MRQFLKVLWHNITHKHITATRDDIGEIEICGKRLRPKYWKAWHRPRIGNEWGMWQEVTEEELMKILYTKKP